MDRLLELIHVLDVADEVGTDDAGRDTSFNTAGAINLFLVLLAGPSHLDPGYLLRYLLKVLGVHETLSLSSDSRADQFMLLLESAKLELLSSTLVAEPDLLLLGADSHWQAIEETLDVVNHFCIDLVSIGKLHDLGFHVILLEDDALRIHGGEQRQEPLLARWLREDLFGCPLEAGIEGLVRNAAQVDDLHASIDHPSQLQTARTVHTVEQLDLRTLWKPVVVAAYTPLHELDAHQGFFELGTIVLVPTKAVVQGLPVIDYSGHLCFAEPVSRQLHSLIDEGKFKSD